MGTLLDNVYAAFWGYLAFSVVTGDQPIADTKYGRLRGLIMRSKGSDTPVMSFLGVPYAKPPVGDRRLALSQPPASWEGVRDATQHGPACPQDEASLKASWPGTLIYPDSGQSEDCLHLDVYTSGLQGQRPTLVVIHGGAFLYAKNHLLISGTSLAAYEDIVVVSINYRLGALGNLYDAGGAWPSNLGLRDQQLALRWVQDNIAAFGGDPERVTLDGESGGAIAVAAHILAPSSRGLFHRAIARSASIFSQFRTKDAKALTHDIADSLDCPTDDSQATLHCLRQKPVEDILAAQAKQPLVGWDQVWDGDFLPADAHKAYRAGDFSRVDFMSGVTSTEGYMLIPMATPELMYPAPDMDTVLEQFTTVMSGVLGFRDVDDIIEYTFGEESDAGDVDLIRHRVMDTYGECTIQVPTYVAARLHSAHVGNSYFYVSEQQPSFMTGQRPAWHRGCDHGLDSAFVFGLSMIENFMAEDATPMTAEESEFSKTVMKYIANFVKTGNPNGEGLPEWEKFTPEKENVQILQHQIDQDKKFKPEAMQFWKGRLPALHKKVEHDEL